MVQIEQPKVQAPQPAQEKTAIAPAAAIEPDLNSATLPPRTSIQFFTSPLTESPLITAGSNLQYVGVQNDGKLYVSQMTAWQISGANAKSQDRDVNCTGMCDGQVFTAASTAATLPIITGPEDSLRKLTSVSVNDAILVDLTDPGSVAQFGEAFRHRAILSLNTETDPMTRLQRMRIPQRGDVTPENLRESVNGCTDLVADVIRGQGAHGCIVPLPQPSGEYHLGVIILDGSKVSESPSAATRTSQRAQQSDPAPKITAI